MVTSTLNATYNQTKINTVQLLIFCNRTKYGYNSNYQLSSSKNLQIYLYAYKIYINQRGPIRTHKFRILWKNNKLRVWYACSITYQHGKYNWQAEFKFTPFLLHPRSLYVNSTNHCNPLLQKTDFFSFWSML